MPNDRQPREKRRVMFRPPEPAIDPTPNTSYMILGDSDAERIERIVERPRTHEPVATSLNPDASQSDQQSSKFPYLSARELASAADKGLQRAHVFRERAVSRAAVLAAPAVDAAKRRLPSLATLAGLGGKRAPGEDNDPPPPSDPDSDQNSDSTSPNPLRRRPEPQSRVVHLNDEHSNSLFPTNYIATTKYSLWSALPMFLFEQFSRFSNAYFLVVGIGYTIDKVSPVFTIGRYSTLWVLAIVVAISGIKEAIEDYNRYREDRRLNQSRTSVVGSRDRDRWASVHVGDILKIKDREHLPADIVIVATSNDDGLAYIETKQLDGESNLKVKVVPPAISAAFSTERQALLTKGRIECEAPNDRLYKFSGRMILDKVPLPPPEESLLDDTSHSNINSVTINDPVPLGPEHLMVRGSSVRNTEWVMGIVVNTGRDTKLMQNVKPRPRKNSRLERETNRHYFMSLLMQIVIIITLTVRSSNACDRLFGNGQFAWYLLSNEDCRGSERLLKLFTFFITFSALIPQSLYVSMEIVRAFQVYFIENDQTIVDPETKVRTEVRTSNLNEELGVIHHVFTDKTGTLTANRMEFKKCSIAGRVFEQGDALDTGATSLREVRDALQAGPESSAIRDFSVHELEDLEMVFRLLALCHSVVAEIPDTGDTASDNSEISTDTNNARRRNLLRRRRNRRHSDAGEGSEASEREVSSNPKSREPSSLNSSIPRNSGQSENRPSSSLNGSNTDGTAINYQASSPDEAALVQAARVQGFTFLSRSNKDVVIDVFGRQEVYELLETIEFDSTRKRMSVITRDSEGRVHIFTKGADAIIFARLAPDQSPFVTEQHLHDFAVEGLRTLCLAYALLDNDWFEDWHRRYRLASSEIHKREEAMAVVADEIERDLILLGATAIEDKLQDGVPDTLRKLEQAGVKIWVLTGDKQETAINIGLSCGAIDEGMDVVIINEDNLEDTAAQIDRALGRWSAMLSDPSMERKLGLVIDGQTLHYALEKELQRKLMVVCRMARSVIACRVSPKQKTEIVELVRTHDKEKVTLAIGDGANDVGMIQAAHVGVGIVGLEGQEAKLASDYSIGQFRFLARLMLVHGRWNYKRLSKMVLYTVYKNAALTLCEMYWATFSAFSGQPLLDPWFGGLYNLFLSSLPPVVLGIFDQELAADYALAFPEIYAKGQRNTAYNFRVFLSWLLSALWQSATIFFVVYWGFGDAPDSSGQSFGMWAFGTVVFSVVVVNIHVMLLVFQSSWNRLTASFFAVSLIAWFILGPIFSLRSLSLNANLSPPLYAITHRLFSDARFWLVLILCPVICASPSLLWKYSKRRRRPNVKMLVQELLRSGKTREDITGEPQKPLHRLPSYDPNRPATPSAEPVTFVVKGEREYQFSGFNFDAGESGSVLRHTFHTSRVVRRKRMRVLKRSGSDTELHVEDLKSTPTRRSNENYNAMTSEWVRRNASIDKNYDDLVVHQSERQPDRSFEKEQMDVAKGAASTSTSAAHRRTVSDGAVLLQDRFLRLDQQAEDTTAGTTTTVEAVAAGTDANVAESASDDDEEIRTR